MTVTGNPAEFTVNGVAATVNSLTVPFSPIQDLNGYDHPWIGTDYDQQPYNFRAVSSSSVSPLGNSEMGNIVGGTVAWNQLVEMSIVPSADHGITYTAGANGNSCIITGTASANEQRTGWFGVDEEQLVSGHKILITSRVIKGSFTGTFKYGIAQAGGVADIGSSLIKNVPYTGQRRLQTVIAGNTAFEDNFEFQMNFFDLTAMFGSTIADYLYTLESGTAGAGVAKLKSWGFCTKPYYAYDAGSLQSVNTSAHKTYKADNTLLGNYALDSSLTLRGIPKLDANNNLYYDGDSYAPDGTVTRKYGSRAYQNGDATDGSTMITDGTNTVYKLTTTTAETATAYAATQSIDPDGTEEYVDYAESHGTRDVSIPVGHYTNYANICPITGRTGLSVYVSPTQDVADATTYAVDWTSEAGTVYGGAVDVVTGLLTVDRANIASYNGETITEPWLSSMDAYVEGATPTTGAQVVYTLATPLTYQLSAQTINLLAGITNYVWSDTNEDITISFDVAAYIRHLFRVNGVDFSRFVERDSYATALEPVYAETIQTMDGVNHTALLRTRGSIRLRFNPQTDSDTAALCSALLAAPCEVQYRCLQRDVDVTALMCVDTISAQFLSRCLYLGDEWNQIESITLTEL